jgi:hypothetical protein
MATRRSAAKAGAAAGGGPAGAAPGDEALRARLGAAVAAWDDLLGRTAGFERAWKDYGGRIGWQLKISRARKALCWATPQDGAFRAAFALRDDEREALLDLPGARLPAEVKDALRSAVRAGEGWPLRLTVTPDSGAGALRSVLDVLLPRRS